VIGMYVKVKKIKIGYMVKNYFTIKSSYRKIETEIQIEQKEVTQLEMTQKQDYAQR
jgi:hypothetical protein